VVRLSRAIQSAGRLTIRLLSAPEVAPSSGHCSIREDHIVVHTLLVSSIVIHVLCIMFHQNVDLKMRGALGVSAESPLQA